MTMKWTIPTNDQETEALLDLSEQMDLPPEKIFIQALKLYQAWAKGALKVEMQGPGCGVIE